MFHLKFVKCNNHILIYYFKYRLILHCFDIRVQVVNLHGNSKKLSHHCIIFFCCYLPIFTLMFDKISQDRLDFHHQFDDLGPKYPQKPHIALLCILNLITQV